MQINVEDPLWLFDEAGAQRAVDWKSNNPLGIVEMPISLGEEYEYNTNRIILDIQQKEEEDYIVYVSKGDTGRIIRLQICDNGVAKNINFYSVYLTTYNDNLVKIKDNVNISTSKTDAGNGYIEYILDSTDTSQNTSMIFKIAKAGEEITFAKSVYIYICDKTQLPDTEQRADLVLKKGTTGINIYIYINQKIKNQLDDEYISSAYFYWKNKETGQNGNFGLTKGGKKFINSGIGNLTANEGIYYCYILCNFYTGKSIKIPTAGFITIKVV